VEQVAAKGRISGESHGQRERRYELNQKDSKDRGPAVPSERGDGLLRHHLCPQQTDRQLHIRAEPFQASQPAPQRLGIMALTAQRVLIAPNFSFRILSAGGLRARLPDTEAFETPQNV
jgi:hypothetical protein